jgi:hypothetical protein
MSNFFTSRFKDADYLPISGQLGEKRLLGVNHICIHEDATVFNDLVIPFGAKDIEEKGGEVIDEILHEIVHHIQAKENREKEIIVCGTPKAKRMFGRKLEDRLKRGVRY